jgi:hypothetical protein
LPTSWQWKIEGRLTKLRYFLLVYRSFFSHLQKISPTNSPPCFGLLLFRGSCRFIRSYEHFTNYLRAAGSSFGSLESPFLGSLKTVKAYRSCDVSPSLR